MKISELIESKIVNGWDDYRLLTISGMRNRGIAEGTMAVMCNGMWKVVGINSISPVKPTPKTITPKVVTTKPKSAVDYLTEKVTQLKS